MTKCDLKENDEWGDIACFDETPFSPEDALAFRALIGDPRGAEGGSFSTSRGQLLKGRIVEVSKDFVVVDAGLKSEGVVPICEFLDADEVMIGNEVEFLLDQMEGENGQIGLSRDKARALRQWEYIVENYGEGSVVSGKVLRKVKGGLIVLIDGVEAFLPGSQVDNKQRVKSLDDFVGKTCMVKILKINHLRRNVVVSRRELLEEERALRKAVLLEEINEGDVLEGVVKNITDFGAFLEIRDFLDGLLHIIDMSWTRIRHPSEMVQIGDKLKVVVLRVDREKGRLSLGLKQLCESPWDELERRYQPGTRVRGTVVNLARYGAFIEIEPGVEGLAHITEMSWSQNISDPRAVVDLGDQVDAVVLFFNKEEGKIALGLRQIQENPWDLIDEQYPVGSEAYVIIRNLASYGAFGELETHPGIDGLIHVSDMSWVKKIMHPSDILKKGDRVQVKILSIDKQNHRITLGMKQLHPNPWETLAEDMPVGSIVKGEVERIAGFGIFVGITDPNNQIEAFVHSTEICDQPFAKIEDVVQKGDFVTAKVMDLDPEGKKVRLSIREYLLDQGQGSRDDVIMEDESE